MAEISSYPLKTPKSGDLITFSETYDANAANPVVGNPTKSATIGSINALAVTGSVGTIPVFTGTNTVGNSQLVQLGPNSNGLYQIKFNNADRIIVNKPSSVTDGDPEFLVMQDDVAKVSMGWDDDGDGYGFLYNWAGNGWRFGSAGNNPELTIVTAAGQEGVTIANSLTVNSNIDTLGSYGYLINGYGWANEASGVLTLGDWDGSDFVTRIMDENGTEVLRVADGRVGIGTSTPSQKLHVDGAARVTGGYYDSSNSPGTSGQVLSSNGSSTSWIDGSAIPGTISGSGLADRVVRWTGSNTITSSSIRDNGTNVGIGQSTAGDENLTVGSGTGIGNGGLFIKDPFAGASRFVSSKNPMLSLGTAAVNGATSTIFMGHNATAENQESKIEYNRGTGIDAGLSIWFKGQGTYREHLRFGSIASSTPRSAFFGDVGINTTSPSAKLDVVGTVKATNDIEITTSNQGLILKSPDGTRYRVTVANGGTLSVSAV